MKRQATIASVLGLWLGVSAVLLAHPHPAGTRKVEARVKVGQGVGSGVSGQGTMRFRVLHASEHLPAPAVAVLDFVLTAKILGSKPLQAAWGSLAFGGKGEGPGQFGTGHGITVPSGQARIDVADRPRAEIDRFSPDGRFLSTLKLPAGSFPCDIDYLDRYAVVGCLHGPDREKGAPIYILEEDRLVSTILPKEELGLVNFQHIHNAVLHRVNGRLYIIAQAWNPGDFAILEQVVP